MNEPSQITLTSLMEESSQVHSQQEKELKSYGGTLTIENIFSVGIKSGLQTILWQTRIGFKQTSLNLSGNF